MIIQFPDWVKSIAQDRDGDIWMFSCYVSELTTRDDKYHTSEGMAENKIRLLDISVSPVHDWKTRKFNVTDNIMIKDWLLTNEN